MALSKTLRFQILRRDNHTCRYCGGAAPEVALHVDHVIPVALGGTSTPDNLVAACASCNSGKGRSAPDEETVAKVSKHSLEYQEAIARAAVPHVAAATRIRANYQEFTDFMEDFMDEWRRHGWASDLVGPMSVFRFWLMGVPEDVLIGHIESVNARTVRDGRAFRYWAGIIWGLIRDEEDRPPRGRPRPEVFTEDESDVRGWYEHCRGAEIGEARGRYLGHLEALATYDAPTRFVLGLPVQDMKVQVNENAA